MKKTLLLATLALTAWQLAGAAAPQPVNPPAPLPAGVSARPEQGFIDTSNPVNPKGVSSIGFIFQQEVMVNSANTTPALLYYQDFDTPADQTLTASVDQMTWLTGGVIFRSRTWTLSGVYKVEVPEGMFLYVDGEDANGDPTGKIPVPAMTLYYEIYKGYSVTPGGGTVDKLDTVVLTFGDATEVSIVADQAKDIQFYMDNSSDVYSCRYEVKDYDGDGRANDVVFTLRFDGNPVTAPGIYGLNIPDGAFNFKVPAADGSGSVDWSCHEILVKYTIPHSPRPEIDPDPDFTVKSFDQFMLYLPDGLQLMMVDTMGHSPLYRVDDDGTVDTTLVYVYAKADFPEEGSTFVTLRLYDALTHEQLDTYTPPKGMYCLRTVPSLLYGTWPAVVPGQAPFTGGSDSYDYFYNVEGTPTGTDSPVIGVAPASDTAVYNIHGLRVADSVSAELPKGFYISGGRKFVVK